MARQNNKYLVPLHKKLSLLLAAKSADKFEQTQEIQDLVNMYFSNNKDFDKINLSIELSHAKSCLLFSGTVIDDRHNDWVAYSIVVTPCFLNDFDPQIFVGGLRIQRGDFKKRVMDFFDKTLRIKLEHRPVET